MRRIHFWLRLTALGCMLISLFFYQKAAVARAEVMAENEAQIAEREAYNKEIERKIKEAEAEAQGTEARGCYNDGVYTGTAMGFGGEITVSVTIENGFIVSIDVPSHELEDPAYYAMAEALLSDIVNEQYADVDTVTGATFSSQGLINAAAEALGKADPS